MAKDFICPYCESKDWESKVDATGVVNICSNCRQEINFYYENLIAQKEGKKMWKCNECSKVFKKTVGKKTFEIKCPRCKSTDVEPSNSNWRVDIISDFPIPYPPSPLDPLD